jgi:excisionase family DNA binding protein
MPVELYSITETASHLGLHPKTVERMIRRGDLNAVRVGDKKAIRIRADELQAFIDARSDSTAS